ncbi:DNA adenine methylase [Pedobacter sp. HMF7647]|uniref:site-specific DNA-methyltransferase (adenine-specific) n=1 Tax=Hufsiella arboris TaxID=2695275 RepID=A0A7K1Y5V4_9SPHI|nr:DNA adenine methylase [Hufsiella arboris]MXV49964.1 DNA adenine methylase [Hufsiella arboris]
MGQSRTPLRYPGGKQKLSPFIFELLKENDLVGGHYVEPYAGGAGAAMDLLLSGKVDSVHLNDSSFAVYAFWRSILNRTEEFCRQIRSASLTVEEWQKHKYIIKNHNEFDEFEVGFSTFYLNRCNRSGVLTAGLIGGNDQSGKWKMDARFSRNDLIKRVEAIAINATSISLSNLDTEVYLRDYGNQMPANTLIYFDPPYYEKASGLYLDFYKKQDHSRLSDVIQQRVNQKWVLSYDGAEEIISLYNQRRLFLYDLQYNASTVYKGKEVFIFCDDLRLPASSCLSYIDRGLRNIEIEMPV